MQSPVYVLNGDVKRESGRKAQLANIEAATAVGDIIRTTLGPRSMLKMILDPMGGITMTNDGNAILREIDVAHPAAKSMIELSRTQDEEVGDGTTSVIILAAQFLEVAQPFLKDIHPRRIVAAYYKALEDSLAVLEGLTEKVDVNDKDVMMGLVQSCLGTKFVSRFGDMICRMALEAVHRVTVVDKRRKVKDIDIKRYARVERIPGGMLEDSRVLDGICINKDVIFAKMKRKIVNPRIVLLDCPLEYKKGESQTALEITEDDDFEKILKAEEDFVEKMCKDIIRVRPSVVLTEKGCSDLAQHYLSKAGISVLRRMRKTDNNRIARATGATIVNEPASLKESDVGTECGLFEVRKIGDEYWSFFVQCKQPRACTIMLRGASNDVLKEISRNLDDAMSVARNILLDPRVVPGGGATEMALGSALQRKSTLISGVQQWPYKAISRAFEIIPRTLIENCGGSSIRLLTDLRAKHAEGKNTQWGIDGNKGVMSDMRKLGVLDPYVVKAQTIKTAMEAACMLLRIDDVVSGLSSKQQQ